MNLYRPSDAIERVVAASLRPSGASSPTGSISLSMGEPDFGTPSCITAAAIGALEEGWTHYGDLNGDPELRERIALDASAEAGRQITADDVLVTHGGAAAITATVLALVNPGDRVVVPEPTYSLYFDAARMAGGQIVFVPTRPDNQLDLEATLAAAEGARMIILCNPVNPTGAVFSGESLRELGRGLQGKDTLLLADEAYAHMVYDEPFVSALSLAELHDRLVYCQTLSKTYAMTGWRIGYVVAPPELSPWIRAVHRTMNSSVNAFAQRGALEALRRGPSVADGMLEAYRVRRDYVVERLKNIPGVEFEVPAGAFYAFFRYPQDIPSATMLEKVRRYGVELRAGTEYGPSGEGRLRLSFAADLDTLKVALDRIETAILGIG